MSNNLKILMKQAKIHRSSAVGRMSIVGLRPWLPPRLFDPLLLPSPGRHGICRDAQSSTRDADIVLGPGLQDLVERFLFAVAWWFGGEQLNRRQWRWLAFWMFWQTESVITMVLSVCG